MNERIQLLAVQAWSYAEVVWKKQAAHPGLLSNKEIEYFFEQKFAQLIIQECVKIIKNKSNYIVSGTEKYTDNEEDLDTVKVVAWQFLVLGEDLKEHFGVKE